MFLLAEDGVFTIGVGLLFALFSFLALGIAAAVLIGGVRWLSRVTSGDLSTIPQATFAEALPWITTAAVTVAVAGVAATAASVLAVFGLSWIAVVIAAALIAAIALRPRFALPLGVVTVTLCWGAAQTNGDPGLLDPSSGLLIVKPATSRVAEQSSPYRRGLGSILVDLRDTRLDRSKATSIGAIADTGRVVVALPGDRCVNLRIKAKRPEAWVNDTRTIASVTRAARDFGLLPVAENQRGAFPAFNPPEGHVVPAESTGAIRTSLDRPAPADLALFGQTVLGDSSVRPIELTRKVREGAPWVELDLTAATAIIVRDYPPGAQQLGQEYAAKGDEYPELANADWPANEVRGQLPAPSDQRFVTWRAWKKGGVPEAARLARKAAGPCPSRDELSSHWTTVDTTDRPDLPDAATLRQLEAWDTQTGVRVNGLGTVKNIGVVRAPNNAAGS